MRSGNNSLNNSCTWLLQEISEFAAESITLFVDRNLAFLQIDLTRCDRRATSAFLQGINVRSTSTICDIMRKLHLISYFYYLALILLVEISVRANDTPNDAKYVIGIDLGTESARVGLFSLRGDVIGTSAVTYSTTFPQVGWAEQNPDEWWSSLGEACRRVTSSALSERYIPDISRYLQRFKCIMG